MDFRAFRVDHFPANMRVGIYMAFLTTILRLLAIALFSVMGVGLASCSFEELRRVRQIERIPESPVAELLTGEAKSQGEATTLSAMVAGPYSGVAALYLVDLVEREETDSDGDTRWVTVRREISGGDFLLKDGGGEVRLVNPAATEVKAPKKFSRREGDMRYSEFRIDPGDSVFVSGFIRWESGKPTFRFDAPGDYVPLISTEPELATRKQIALGSLAFCAAAVVCWSLAVYQVCRLFRVHLTLLFLGLQGAAISMSLLGLGLQAAHQEIAAAHARITRLGGDRLALLREATQDPEMQWDRLPEMPTEGRHPQAIRMRAAVLGYASAAVRFNRAIGTLPESLLAAASGIAPVPSPKLPPSLREEAERREEKFQPTRLGAGIALGAAGGSVALALWFSRLGFGTVKKKRLVENIPTTKTTGVVYGLNELTGTAEVVPPAVPLTGPLTQLGCVYYAYRIQERRGTGKNARWVTVHSEKKMMPFQCRDAEGEIEVFPEGAEFLSGKTKRKREGARRYTETRIETGDSLYLLGSAKPDEATGERLVICREASAFFLIANLSERDVLQHKAGAAFRWLTAAMNVLAVGGLAAVAWIGGMNAASYSAAGLAPACYALGILAILMFNDLVFLRQRTRAAWSNIEVALKKRHDLLGQFQKVATGLLAHERELLPRLAALRTSPAAGPELLALREAWPVLQSSELAIQISAAIVRVENEIALMREGYNNAVERYRTRCGHFPEWVFARLFHFKEAPFWSGDAGPGDGADEFQSPVSVA